VEFPEEFYNWLSAIHAEPLEYDVRRLLRLHAESARRENSRHSRRGVSSGYLENAYLRMVVKMIALRFTLAAALAAFSIGAAGCSATGNDSGLPGSANQTSAGLNFEGTKERVTISQFADLPVYQDYYGPSAIASGPRRSLWVTDTIDQDFGENAVVEIATSGKARNTFYYGGKTSEGSDFLDITADPDGALWITDTYNGQILRMTTSGTYTGMRCRTGAHWAS
jgi:hypothetical protein